MSAKCSGALSRARSTLSSSSLLVVSSITSSKDIVSDLISPEAMQPDRAAVSPRIPMQCIVRNIFASLRVPKPVCRFFRGLHQADQGSDSAEDLDHALGAARGALGDQPVACAQVDAADEL